MSSPPTEQQFNEIIRVAKEIRQAAYAPFSNFHVGAALLTTDGRVFAGVNVENSSYGLTICAERSAAVTAVTAGYHEFAAIAIASPGGVTPCGACRQFLFEFGDLRVLMVDANQKAIPRNCLLSELLPDGFRFS